jgi:hypothetical protein
MAFRRRMPLKAAGFLAFVLSGISISWELALPLSIGVVISSPLAAFVHKVQSRKLRVAIAVMAADWVFRHCSGCYGIRYDNVMLHALSLFAVSARMPDEQARAPVERLFCEIVQRSIRGAEGLERRLRRCL